MATLPAWIHKTDAAAIPGIASRTAPVRGDRDPHRLRPLPQEDVFFYCKKIDNSRLVREADPKAPKACWSAIGVAGLVLTLLTGVLAPQVAGTLAGYKLESLRAEQRRLLDECRHLELREAELLSVNRLEQLAKARNLSAPQPDQVVHLNGKDSSVAMMK